MPLESSLSNTICYPEQISREFSEDMIVSRYFGYKWDCMGISDKVMIWILLRRDYIREMRSDNGGGWKGERETKGEEGRKRSRARVSVGLDITRITETGLLR